MKRKLFLLHNSKLLSGFLFICLYANVNAATFNCNSLYIGGQNGRVNNYAEVKVLGTNTFQGADFYMEKYNQNPTLAIGPYKDKITLYWWDYDLTTSSGSSSGNTIYYAHSGAASGTAIPQSPSSIPFGTKRLSGGTVNQKTGEIYLLPEPGDAKKDQIISILAPSASGTFYMRQSPRLGFTENVGGRAYASDMAIDADGNAYLLVNTDSKSSTTSSYYRLLKVNPNDNWNYDFVGLQNDINIARPSSSEVWGMAFLNGKLYVTEPALGEGTAYLHAIDPIKGGDSQYGTLTMQDGKKYGYAIDDIASCQTASAISGKIYLDKNGDGKIDDNDKTGGKYQFVSNVVVEIYEASTNALLGYQTTNIFGEYSFLVELKKTYYIRLRQPQINGANTHQTWASGGEFSWQSSINIGTSNTNYVIPACYNNGDKIYDTTDEKTWYSGKETKKRFTQTCYGARADGIDPSYSTTKEANYITTVAMLTDLSVAHADFALAAIDRGDAPSSFGVSSNYMLQNGVKMGDLIDSDLVSLASSNADGDDKNGLNDEDGVEVKAADKTDAVWEKLTNFNFNSLEGKYIFRVKVNEGGFLSAWINMNSNAINLSDFKSGTKIADNIPYDNDTGYITFEAEIKTKIDTDGGYVNGMKVSKLKNLFFRFRYTSYQGAIDPSNINRGNSQANQMPWALDGESEDYKANYQYIDDLGEPKGALIVVNQNFNTAKDGKNKLNSVNPVFALYSQIVNMPFEAQMIYYNENGDSIASSLDIPIEVNVDVVDFNGNCGTSPVIQNAIYSGNLTEISKKLSNLKINKAVKNAAFKTTYKYKDSVSKKISCSLDTFSVRPAKFEFVGGLNANLIGGDETKTRLRAVNYENANAYGYNQTGVNIASNATLIAPPNCTLNADASGECHTEIRDFTNGIADISVRYQNVGRINMELTDKEWTNIDGVKSDCVVDSALNTHNLQGKVGCDIKINQNINFLPSYFDVNVKAGNANDANFTYLSNSTFMSAYIETSIKAMLADGNVAANYHKNCFSDDITYDVSLMNNNLTGWDNRKSKTPMERLTFFPEHDDAQIVKNNIGGGNGTFKIKRESFNAGEANNIKFKFNFGRSVTQAEDPFKINSSLDFNVTNISDTTTSNAVVNIENDNITFFYGRIFSNNYEEESPISAEIRYEVYYSRLDSRDEYGLDIAHLNLGESKWFLNAQHNSTLGDIVSYAADGMSLVEYPSVSSNGKSFMNIINNSNHTPYSDIIHVKPDSWLIYNHSNENAHNISFTVKFIGDPSDEWAGKGSVNASDDKNAAVGKTIDATPSKRTGGKISW